MPPTPKKFLVQWLGWQIEKVDRSGRLTKKWSDGQISTVEAYGIESAKKAYAEFVLQTYGRDIRQQGGTVLIAEKPPRGSGIRPEWHKKVYR